VLNVPKLYRRKSLLTSMRGPDGPVFSGRRSLYAVSFPAFTSGRAVRSTTTSRLAHKALGSTLASRATRRIFFRQSTARTPAHRRRTLKQYHKPIHCDHWCTKPVLSEPQPRTRPRSLCSRLALSCPVHRPCSLVCSLSLSIASSLVLSQSLSGDRSVSSTHR